MLTSNAMFQDFYWLLKDHLLTRLQERGLLVSEEPEGYSFQDRARLVIHKELLFWHEVLRLNWTSYDLQRSQDAVNPKNHSDIMLLADCTDDNNDSAHPYIYAQVVRVFHVNARLYDSPMQAFEPMDVLFVRWFHIDMSAPGGFTQKHLHRVEFVPRGDQKPAFGFVDPLDVVRGTHIVPAFAYGRTSKLLGPSMACDIASVSDKPRSTLRQTSHTIM